MTEPAAPPPNLNLGAGFTTALVAAKAASEAARLAGTAAECLDCKRAQFDLARERERADHLYSKVEALSRDLQVASARTDVSEFAVVMTQGETIRRLQQGDVTQRRNIALAEAYVTELQQFIRDHCQAEPPSLTGALGWRRNEREGSAT